MSIIYLDNAATSRLDPEVKAAMEPFLTDKYGNAASKYYSLGQDSLRAVEAAREETARLLGAASPEEIAFTSCATESNSWVILSLLLTGKKKHLVTTAVEHHCVLHPAEFLAKEFGVEVTVLPVDAQGLVDPAAAKAAIRDDTALVSVMHANNEVGTLQPVREIADLAHARGALFHTDACQTVGKLPVAVGELGADLLSLSAHKFHGPKGVGALYIRRGVRLPPLLRGGGQERGRRAGTQNVAGIVGLGRACELAAGRLATEGARQSALVERLWSGLSARVPKIRRNGHPERRLPNLLSVCVEGAEGEAILGYLDMFGIIVSSGSACATGSLDPSHVLLAMGLPAEIAHGSLRFSLSHDTAEADVDRVIEVLPGQVETLRAMSVTWKG